MRFELQGYGIITSLIVDGSPYWEPNGLNFLIGMPGSGKTMLAWALYVEPVLMILDAYRKAYEQSLPVKCKEIIINNKNENIINKFEEVFSEILHNAGFRNYVELHNKSMVKVCVEGSQVYDGLRNIGYDPGSVDYACLVNVNGSIGVELILRSGRLETLTLDQAKGLIPGLTMWVSAIVAWPHGLRELLYSITLKQIEKLHELVSKWPRESECPLLRPISILLKTRIPPIAHEEYNISGELELSEGIPIETHLEQGREETLLKLSLGELSMFILKSSKALVKALYEEYSVRPLVLIDDGFDGIPSKYSGFLIETLSEALKYSAIIITTYRPEAIIRNPQDERAKDFIEKYVTTYIATYQLEELTRYAKHGINHRLELISAGRLDDETRNMVYDEF
ncbi:hypothetical protein [Vulcanisaeta sp. JCM 14467]